MSASAERKLYFEDLQIGLQLETPGMTLTEAHVAIFNGLCDTRPGEPGFVPQLLPLCLSSGLGWRVPQPPLVVLAFMGFEWKFVQPARVGDTIRSISKSVAKRTMREGGVVIEERSIVNQRDEVLELGRLTLLIAKRPASARAEAVSPAP